MKRAKYPSDDERVRAARGQVRGALRMPATAWAHLDAICSSSGYSRSEIVETLIEQDWESIVALDWASQAPEKKSTRR